MSEESESLSIAQDKQPSFQFDSNSRENSSPPSGGSGKGGRSGDIGEIFSRALQIYMDNPVLIVPSLIPVSAFLLGMMIFAGYLGLVAIFWDGGLLALSAVTSLLLFVVLMVVLLILAEGASIEMIREASLGRKADLSSAWQATRSHLEPLILTSVLAGIIIAIGYAFFILPGLIFSLAFYFVPQAVMIEGKSGLEALKTSWGFVQSNLSHALIVVLASLAIAASLHSVPFIGPLLGLISLPYIYGLATLLYIERRVGAADSQATAEWDVEIS